MKDLTKLGNSLSVADVEEWFAEQKENIAAVSSVIALVIAFLLAVIRKTTVRENAYDIDDTQNKLLQTMDGMEWATEFVRTNSANPKIAYDIGTMNAWFANAIMVGYDHGVRSVTTDSGTGKPKAQDVGEYKVYPATKQGAIDSVKNKADLIQRVKDLDAKKVALTVVEWRCSKCFTIKTLSVTSEDIRIALTRASLQRALTEKAIIHHAQFSPKCMGKPFIVAEEKEMNPQPMRMHKTSGSHKDVYVCDGCGTEYSAQEMLLLQTRPGEGQPSCKKCDEGEVGKKECHE